MDSFGGFFCHQVCIWGTHPLLHWFQEEYFQPRPGQQRTSLPPPLLQGCDPGRLVPALTGTTGPKACCPAGTLQHQGDTGWSCQRLFNYWVSPSDQRTTPTKCGRDGERERDLGPFLPFLDASVPEATAVHRNQYYILSCD